MCEAFFKCFETTWFARTEISFLCLWTNSFFSPYPECTIFQPGRSSELGYHIRTFNIHAIILSRCSIWQMEDSNLNLILDMGLSCI